MTKLNCLIIAHRGESFDAPENTMSAINLAWERDDDAVEVDVQLTRDNELVVIHDENAKRLTGIDKPVRKLSADEIRLMDAGSWMDIQWKGEKVPLLREVLDSVPADKKLIIEIKGDHQTVPILAKLIKDQSISPEQVEFIAFDLKAISLMKTTLPEYKALWLLELDYGKFNRLFWTSIKKAIQKARSNYLDGLNVWSGKMLDSSLVEQVKSAGLFLYVWTVNDIGKAEKLIEWGVDAITTDGAHWMKSHLTSKS